MENRPSRDRAGVARYVLGIIAALTVSVGCMALIIGTVLVAPAAMPVLWIGVPFATFCGMLIVHRRFPADTYVIGLIFVPVVTALLGIAALQVSWSVGGNAL